MIETLKYNIQYHRKLSLDRRNFLVYASVARGIATDQDLTSSIQQTKCSLGPARSGTKNALKYANNKTHLMKQMK